MKKQPSPKIRKAPTGIAGFDEMTRGGIPRGRATLLLGGPGSGKTLMALETLVNGARKYDEPGIFVAFEESADRITENAAALGWNLSELARKKLFFLDAQPSVDLVQSGGFDLIGMLSALETKARQMGAKRIVFDSVDRVLELLNDPRAERREIYRLHEWLLSHELTAMITAKTNGGTDSLGVELAGTMQFMVDCAVTLTRDIVNGVSQRSLRVLKYRGSAFSENVSPLLFGPHGLEVAGLDGIRSESPPVTHERVSSGIQRLDKMLGGGYFRGANILVTGAPGTAKTTLGGAFAEAACGRGERTMFVSFDSEPAEIVRNLASVKIRLDRFQRRGLLNISSAHAGDGSAEAHYLHIRSMAREHRTRCMVIDPVSALAKPGNGGTILSVVERLTRWAKSEGITLVCSSLLDGAAPETEATRLQVSTIADTWIHLSYRIQSGERNRALTIIKSRGTPHSNQVRELVLSHSGITLAEIFTAGGEVLMGTLRWEKEQAVLAEQKQREEELHRKRKQLSQEEAELAGRIEALERDLTEKRAERKAMTKEEFGQKSRLSERESSIHRMRQGDAKSKRQAKPRHE